MTKPERIVALRDSLAEVGRAVASFQGALTETNEPAYQDFFGELLGRIGLILKNESAGVTMELAGDLQKARHDLRRIALPEKDPDLDTSTPALRALRGERGNLVEALENALDATRALGLEPRLSEFGELKVPRDPIATQLARLDERLRSVQDTVDAVRRAANAQDAASAAAGENSGVSQRGLINLHVAALTVEVSAARFETRTGDNPAIPPETDLAALARTTEAIRDIGRDLRATVQDLHGWVAPAVAVLGELVARAAERSWSGARTVIRFVRRMIGKADSKDGTRRDPPPGDFDIEAAKHMILAGRTPPQDWLPFIEELDFEGTDLAVIKPLASLVNLRSLSLNKTLSTDLAPIAGLVSIQRLNLNQTRIADLAPIVGLTNLRQLSLNRTPVADVAAVARLGSLRSLSFNSTQVADLAPIAGLANLQRLWLNNTQVADLAPIAGLAKLQSLHLDGTQVADLAPVAGLASLQRLYVSNTPVADLAPIAGLASLQRLSVSNTQVADLAPIAGLANLQYLYLNNTLVADLAPIAGLANLQTLSISNTKVADLAPIAGTDVEVHIGGKVIRPKQWAREGRSLKIRRKA